ncbi:MAG: hypothetical protein ACFE94_02820 [Candidatus Hodarchaeota archaeon]
MKIFKKTFKFICDKCGEFAHTETEYCESCGEKSLRKATKDDYAKYEREKMRKTREDKAVMEETRKAEKADIKAEKAEEKAKKEVEKAEIKAEKAEEKAKMEVEKAEIKAEEKAKKEAE